MTCLIETQLALIKQHLSIQLLITLWDVAFFRDIHSCNCLSFRISKGATRNLHSSWTTVSFHKTLVREVALFFNSISYLFLTKRVGSDGRVVSRGNAPCAPSYLHRSETERRPMKFPSAEFLAFSVLALFAERDVSRDVSPREFAQIV